MGWRGNWRQCERGRRSILFAAFGMEKKNDEDAFFFFFFFKVFVLR